MLVVEQRITSLLANSMSSFAMDREPRRGGEAVFERRTQRIAKGLAEGAEGDVCLFCGFAFLYLAGFAFALC